MSTKLKLVLGVLIVGIFFLFAGAVFSVAKSISSSNSTANIYSQSKNNTAVSDRIIDLDHDGIPNSQEEIYHTDPRNADTDGDGFFDGEEVMSGCNPILAESTDCPNQSKSNITTNVSQILAGSIQADGDVDMERLALLSMDSFESKIYAKDADVFSTISDPTSTDLYNYINNLKIALSRTLLGSTKNLKRDVDAGFMQYFQNKGAPNANLQKLQEDFAQDYEHLKNVAVPNLLADYH